MSALSILLFVGIIALTLLITYFSSKKTKSTSDFYTAGGGLTATQNGLAVAGDFMSAASFLGITGAIALVGFDGFYMSIGNLLGFLFLLYLVAEPMRNLGKYTLADMMTSRFKSNKVRGTAAVSTLVISIFYMIAQLVGGGGLISLMLGIDYWFAVVIVGVLMTVYVIFGGMTATSWVQITKAVLLLGGSFVLSFLVFAKFDFSIIQMFEQIKSASPFGEELANPGNKYSNGLDMLSLNLSLVLGVAGLPHLLIRFFTVKDAVTARKSVVYSTWFIGAFFLMVVFLGFGATAFVGWDNIIAANPAGNLAAPMLALAMGGDFLFAFISAVAFATILAVVSALVLTSASAFAHDIYGQIIKKGNITEKQQMKVARISSITVAIASILLSLSSKFKCCLFICSSFRHCSKCQSTSYVTHHLLEKVQCNRRCNRDDRWVSQFCRSCFVKSECMEPDTRSCDLNRRSTISISKSDYFYRSIRFSRSLFRNRPICP